MRAFRFAFLLLTASFAQAAAQSGGSCDITPLGNTLTTQVGGSTYVSGRARYDCTGGVVVMADSAAYLTGGALILVGRVDYSDPDKTLKADRVEYFGREARLVAQGNALVTDKKAGSIIRAPQGLEYLKQTETNPEAKINIYSGRPHITLFRQNQSGATDTTDVDANSVFITGERLFKGSGNVIIKRGRMQTSSGEAELHENGARLALWRTAKIVGEDYTLEADSIYGETEADVFRELRAFRQSRLDGKDVDLSASRLRILLDSGVVNRLIAVGTRGAAASGDIARANVFTPDFNLTADSIDALSPKQQLEQVTAVGKAMGTRHADSLDAKLPELIRNDWLRGDTIIAFFTEASDSIKARRAQNDTSFNRVLEQLIAAGASEPATALYRMRSESDTTNTPQVNYMAAKRITAKFKDGTVHDVDAVEEIRGIYLQPIKRAEPVRPPQNTAQNQTIRRRP
jgi:lipopolysaccharide export system protein LptA